MSDQNLVTRREEARRAMEGDERRQARAKREQTTNKRRVDARLAMESPTHRARREARGRAEREVAGAAEAKVETDRANRAAAAKLIADSDARVKARTAAVETALAARINTARQAAAEIKNLQGRPAHLSAIRTLKTDMAEAVSQGGSVAGAIIQASERGASQTPTSKQRSHATLIIILILIFGGTLAGSGTLVYRRWLINSSPPAPKTTPILNNSGKSAFILADRETAIDTTAQTAPVLLKKIREIAASSQTSGTIAGITFSGNNVPLAFRAWQTFFSLPFSDNLSRIVEPTFMFGFYHGVTSNTPFILLKAKTANRGYAQLLAWENNLPAVWDILIGKPPEILPTATTGPAIITPSFHDRVIQNLDTRILEGLNVPQPALYGFLDPNTILLTQTREVFLEILARFRAGR